MEGGAHPLAAAAGAGITAARDWLASSAGRLHRHLDRSAQPIREVVAAAGALAAHLQRAAAAALAGGGGGAAAAAAPLLASVSAASAPPARAPPAQAFDLALAHNPEEIKFRLQGVPVYAVVNAKNEFVLVSGDDDGGAPGRQLSLLFLAAPDAAALVDTIRRQNPKLGRAARVMATSMDAVYEVAVTPRAESGLEGVAFRLVPDAAQVEAALGLYRAAGVPADGFAGVPLFQAEGLTVRGDKARYTPLFLSKADLDAALGAAHVARDAEARADAEAKAARARGEQDAAAAEAAAAPEGRERRAAQKRADAARARAAKYAARLAELDAAAGRRKPPRVDVGCLEEVIAKMERDDKGEWADVMFVPPAAMKSKGGGESKGDGAPAAAGAGKKR